jgi:osmotically-inducible protein OsmY
LDWNEPHFETCKLSAHRILQTMAGTGRITYSATIDKIPPRKRKATMGKTTSCLALIATVAALLCCSGNGFASAIDDRIEASAKQSYVFRIFLKGDDVTVQSQEGVVTLTGTVSEESYKLLAQEAVASLPEVKSVNNHLAAKGEVPAKYKDAWLVTKVKSTLMFHRQLNAAEIEVTAKEGTITLRGGEAIGLEEKNLATEYAEDVEGVKGVINEMTVLTPGMGLDDTVYREPMDDASITALVKVTLRYHRSTSALEAVVETKEGLVELKGKVGSEAEKDRATKLASDVHGVKTVVNSMTVEER